ncbi:hypothetical protein, partial [Crocosphaera watsonii]|uniref:hypothetical protein n=1 Tax=Crocosphaera watsonii TaxID=263511 RepID=UPI001E32E324
MLSTTFSGTTSYSSSIAYGFEVENLINSSSSDKIYLNNAANDIMGYNPNRSTGQDKIYYGTSQDTLILDYAHYEVTESQSGQNLIINLGGNGSVELVDYYADPNNQIQISYAIPPTPRPEPPEGIDIAIAEIGQISNLDHNNQTIVLDHDFVNPVILAQPLSFNDGGVAIARITDIQSDRFSVEIQEASNEDGIHTVETFSYLVLEEGIWELSDGTIIEVGIINATNSSWSNINFSYDFVDDPVVLTQIQTNNDSNFVKTRHNNITQDGFEVLLEKDEANNDTSYGIETVAWMAISSGTGSWDGNTFMAGNTGDQVTHDWHTIDFGNAFNNTPKFLGNIASYYGPDPSGLRYQNLNNGNVQIKIEEDTSADSEIGHTTEDVDYLAIEATGTLIGSTYGLIPPTSNDPIIAQLGQVTNLDHNNQTIVLDHDFDNPVIFANPLSYNGPAPSIARITDIQGDRFSVELQEPSNEDGTHAEETVSFLALEEGIWELSDGTIIEVGTIDTTHSDWHNINFSYDFVDGPVVLTQIQTNNDSSFVKTRHNNITQDGFEVLLENDEANMNSGHGNETVAWMAISSGTGSWDGNTFMAGNTGDQVTHDWHTIDFGNAFNNTPKFLGNIASYYGPDPSGLRYQNLNNSNVQVKIEEDISIDEEVTHITEDVHYLAIEATGTLTGTSYSPSSDPIIAQLGQVTNLDHNNQTIVLDHDFDNPVIFAQPLSFNGSAPSITRITDIQGDRFSVELQEPSNEDGTHAEETVSFLALEEGIWELSDGTIIEVGTIDTTHSDWHNINFSYDFVDSPVVLTQIQTNNDSSFVKTRHNNITQDGFEVLLENDEANMNSGHGNETVAWMAISSGTGSWDGNTFMAGNTGDQVTHDWHTIDFGNAFNNTPKFLGNIASYYGPDPSGLRYQNLNNGNVEIKIEEDISIDEEVTHITEDVHFLAIEGTGTLTGSTYIDPDNDPDPVSTIAQVGQITNLDENNQTIVLDHDFDNPVIFANPLSYNGPAPSIARITDIQSDRFSVELQEPSNEDGTHAEETFSFLALEKGVWTLSDGTVIEVGTIDTNAIAGSYWENITFDYDFTNAPIVLTQVQTDNDASFVKTRQNNITQDGFDLALENDEANLNSGHGTETVAWVAISSGTGDWDGNTFMAGETGDYVTEAFYTLNFGNAFNKAPKFLGNIASYYGSDPSGLRYQNLNNGNVEIKIEEDTSIDEEIIHITENVHFLAIEGTGTLTGSANTGNNDPLTGIATEQTATASQDIFVVGNAQEPLYDTYGKHDYLEILGFDQSEDVIQLNGIADNYSLGASPFDSNDQGIF